jgi:ankyrin repeat protein
MHQKADLVPLMLRAGASVNERDDFGRTALFYAITHPNDWEVSRLSVQLLIDAGARTDVVDKSGNTLLRTAIQHRNAKCVELLCELGALKGKDVEARAVLQLAISMEETKIVEILRKYQTE